MEFETAAHSEDLGLFYGSVHWGFQFMPEAWHEACLPGAWAKVLPNVSDTLRASVAALNRFYGNKHIVQEGETLASISSIYWGTESHAQLIFEKNKEKLSPFDPSRVITPTTALEMPFFDWDNYKKDPSTNVWERAKGNK